MSPRVLLCSLAVALLSACSPATDEPANAAARAESVASPASAGAQANATRAIGTLGFRIDSGPRAGDYRVDLSDDTFVRQNPMGDSVLLSLRVVGDLSEDATLSFVVNAPLPPPVVGTHDISGALAQVGVLPTSTAAGDPRFFTLSAQSGQLTLERFEPRERRARGSFRLTAAGGEIVEGRFDVGD